MTNFKYINVCMASVGESNFYL